MKMENKKCAICGKPLPVNCGVRRLYCDDCKLIARRIKYQNKREKHICPFCGKEVINGASLCPACSQKNNVRWTARSKTRRENDLCIVCGQPVLDGKSGCCPECYSKTIARIDATRHKRIEQGICAQCGEGPIFKAGYCKKHYQKSRMRSNDCRDRLRKEALCISCHKPAVIRPDGTISPFCAEHEKYKYGAAYKKYWDRRVNGLCVDCGKPTYNDGNKNFSRCAECLAKESDGKWARKKGFPRIRRTYT